MKLVKSVLAELNALFLTKHIEIDGNTNTFVNHIGINNAESVLVSPLQAIITPPTDKNVSKPILVGVGFILSQQPLEYSETFSGELDISTTKNYSFDVIVLVRGTILNAYAALLIASEFLITLGGKTGKIGGHSDPFDSSSDLHEFDVVQIQDAGETDQSIDDQDNYTVTRNFNIIILRE